MTHKEQFKAEIEKVKLIIQSNRAQGAFTEGYLIGQESVLEHFENFVNSLQEEPKFKTGDRIKPIDSCLGSPRIIEEVCDGWYVTNIGTLDFEFEDNWELVEEPAGLDKGKLMGMLEESLSKETKESWNKFLQEEPVNKVDVDAAMAEVEAKAKTFTESHKGESSDEILAQMRGEEPVSEDLEKASKGWLEPKLDKSYANYGEAKMMELTHFDGYAMLDAIEFGAKWQEQQLEKNRLARCDAQTEEEAEREQEFVMQHIKKYHCQPTFSDAIEWGMNLQHEQMTKNAIEGEWWRCSVVLPAKHMNTGDIRSVKIIIIED